MSKDAEKSAGALSSLRQFLVSGNVFDRRAISAEIYKTSYNNPRGARVLLRLLQDDGYLRTPQRNSVSDLLRVLDSDDDF